MRLKIQKPEENQKLPKIYLMLLAASFLMMAITLLVVLGYVFSK